MLKLCLFFPLLLLFSVPAQAYIDEVSPTPARFSGYKPMYFLMGDPDTKIELSLKAQLVEGAPLYLAYTQLMMWELFIKSPYFSDLNYNPEIFYRFKLEGSSTRWLDISFFDHESNGKGGDLERSWNRVSARYQNEEKIGERARLLWNAELWAPYWDGRNSDIAKYRGLGQGVLTLSDFLGPTWEKDELTLRIYLGGATYLNPLQGGQELTFSGKFFERKFFPQFMMQVFRGYGEDLIDYRNRRFGLRAGISF